MKNLIVTLMIGISAAQLTGGEKEKKAVANSSAAIPAALVGQWLSGSLAAANFYNPSTQQWNEPNGRGIFLIVQANGEYRFGAGEQITTIDYFLYHEGSVASNGSEIVLLPKMGSEYVHDVCTHEEEQRASTQDELRAAPLKFQIVADGADARSAKLVLITENGELITLRPCVQ